MIAIHQRHDLSPNPLYLRGASRVGCWPCIHARKEEIRFLADTDPGRIDEIAALEDEVTAGAEARAAAKGETLASLGFTTPTFFHPRTRSMAGVVWRIRDVAAWSKTGHGGKQVELFSDPQDGCARWGFCESTGDKGGK